MMFLLLLGATGLLLTTMGTVGQAVASTTTDTNIQDPGVP